MPVSPNFRFIYIHIPKCAGSSVSAALKHAGARMDYLGPSTSEQQRTLGSQWLHHVTAEKLQGALPSPTWKRSFKFTFVRNPWDLLVSFYHFHKARIEDADFREQRPEIVRIFECASSFEEWLRAGIYARPCSAFLKDADGKLSMDFVGRFENLAADFASVCRHLNIEASLPHEKKSEHQPYRSYYSPELRDVVGAHFREDIERFGYQF
jgi:hypothetical protein